MRPLGIPTIEDRILQQCIKQVLEDTQYLLVLNAQRPELFQQFSMIDVVEESLDINIYYMAYRSIKKNKGSKTKGTNNSTIVQMGEKAPDELIELFQPFSMIDVVEESLDINIYYKMKI